MAPFRGAFLILRMLQSTLPGGKRRQSLDCLPL